MSTTTLQSSSDRFSLVRRWILFDAAFAGVMALVMTFGAGALSELFGLSPVFVRTVGLILVPYAIALAWLWPRVEQYRPVVWVVITGNLLWAVASGALLLTSWVDPTTAGIVFILTQAIIVAGFGDMQFLSLRRTS
jgi:Na+/melibiose symporter-like transporter